MPTTKNRNHNASQNDLEIRRLYPVRAEDCFCFTKSWSNAKETWNCDSTCQSSCNPSVSLITILASAHSSEQTLTIHHLFFHDSTLRNWKHKVFFFFMLWTTKQTTKNDIDRPSFYFCLISRRCSSQLAPRVIVPLSQKWNWPLTSPNLKPPLFTTIPLDPNKHVFIQDASSDIVYAYFGYSIFPSKILPKHEQVAQ